MTICFFSDRNKKVVRNYVDKIVRTEYGFRIYYSEKNQYTFLDFEDVYADEITSPIHIIL